MHDELNLAQKMLRLMPLWQIHDHVGADQPVNFFNPGVFNWRTVSSV